MAKVKEILMGMFTLPTSVNGDGVTYFVHIEPQSIHSGDCELGAWKEAVNFALKGSINPAKTSLTLPSPATNNAFFPKEGWTGEGKYYLHLYIVSGSETLETTLYIKPVPLFAGNGVSF